MGGKKNKKLAPEPEADSTDATTIPTDMESRSSNVPFFLFLGIILTLGFSCLHLLFGGLISFILGVDFLTVVYVTAASVVTGAVITMTLTLIVTLTCIFTFFANLRATAASKRQMSPSPLGNLIPATGSLSTDDTN